MLLSLVFDDEKQPPVVSPAMGKGRGEARPGSSGEHPSFISDDTFDDTTHSSSCWQEKGASPTCRFYSMPLTIGWTVSKSKLPSTASSTSQVLPPGRQYRSIRAGTDKLHCFYPTATAIVNAIKNNPEHSTHHRKWIAQCN